MYNCRQFCYAACKGINTAILVSNDSGIQAKIVYPVRSTSAQLIRKQDVINNSQFIIIFFFCSWNEKELQHSRWHKLWILPEWLWAMMLVTRLLWYKSYCYHILILWSWARTNYIHPNFLMRKLTNFHSTTFFFNSNGHTRSIWNFPRPGIESEQQLLPML